MRTHRPWTHSPVRNLLLLALVAVFCFGGSFTCTTSSHDNDPPPNIGVTGGGAGVNAR